MDITKWSMQGKRRKRRRRRYEDEDGDEDEWKMQVEGKRLYLLPLVRGSIYGKK